MKTRHRKTLFLLSLLTVVLLCICALRLIDVRYAVLRTDDGEVVYLTSVRDGDSVVISHVNSIYDAPVEERLEIRDGQFLLTKVVTDSQGVLEYYGIADTTPRGKWSTIRIFSTEGRDFSLAIKGIPVDALNERGNSHFTLQVQECPLYRFLCWKIRSGS